MGNWTRGRGIGGPGVLAAWLVGMASLLDLAPGNDSVRGEDWPHYLGPRGDTSVDEKGILTEFSAAGFPLRWRVSAGGGYSGPAVSGDRVFLMDRLAEPYQPGEIEGNPNFIRASIPGEERVRALDVLSGEVLWEYAYACPYTTVFLYAIGPRATPTVDGNRVYALGAEGDLHCLSAEDGTVIWSRDFREDYDLEIPEWGCAAHPLVHEDQLICVVGGEGTTVVSFDKHTGSERWRALTASKPGYCPPVLATIHGQQQLLVWHGDGVASLDPESGRRHWFVEVRPQFGMAIGAPRVHRDLVHVMGYKGVSAVLRVAPDNGSAERLWGPDLRRGVAGVLNTAHLDENGYLYSAGGRGRFQCVDIRSGERVWETAIPLQNREGDATGAWPSAFTFPHLPSGRTFIYNDHGELISATLAPEGYHEISRAHLMEPTHEVGGRRLVWSAPAFAHGCLFLRNDEELRCYDMTPEAPGRARNEALYALQRELSEERGYPATTVMIEQRGRTLYHRSVSAGLKEDRRHSSETLFPIWSMSKPVTSVAAMMLWEKGAFGLDDPVENVIPQLGRLRVSDGEDELQPLNRPITYRQLLTHTSGIAGYDGSFDEEGTWKEVMELPDLEAVMDLLLDKPLEHQPGERFTYGLSTAVLGYALEKLEGKSLEELLEALLFTPLGMEDTGFALSVEDRKRFQPLFVKESSALRPGAPAEDELYYRPGSRLQLGGEGLVSTVDDYGRFCRMLVDGGCTPEGRRLLEKSTLDLMLSDQTKDIPGFWGTEEGYHFGLGFQVLGDPGRGKTAAPPGIFGWGGYHGTHFWVDPDNALYVLFMTRRYPSEGAVESLLRDAVYGAESLPEERSGSGRP